MEQDVVQFVITIIKEAGSMGLLALVLFFLGKHGNALLGKIDSLVSAINSVDNSIKQLVTISQESRVKIERIDDTTEDIKEDVRSIKNKAA